MKQQHLIIQALFFGLLVLALFEFNVRFLITQPLFYILISALTVCALVSWRKPEWIKKLQPFAWLAIIVASLAMVLSIHSPSLQAQWGVIDDHEMMVYMGEDGQMSFAEWPKYFMGSEAGNPGKALRYRPTYSALRLGETALWDNNPQYWYVVRIGILTLFIAVAWYVSQPVIGFIGGGLLATYILTSDYWKDIVARLGPSEAYVALGLALFALFFYRVLIKKKHWLNWLGMTMGFIIAVGAKENVIFLLVPVIALAGYLFWKKRLTLAAVVSTVIMTGFTLFMLWAVGSAMLQAGQDVYARSTSTQSRFSVAILSLKTSQSKELMISIMLSLAFLGYIWFRAKDTKLTQPTLIFIMIQSLMLGLFVMQFVFYNGNWPDHSRYDFPGVLYYPIYFISLCWFSRQLVVKTKFNPMAITAMTWAVYLGVAFSIVMSGLVSTLVTVKENVIKTQAHTQRIQTIANALKNNPDASVILESSNVWDYEPAYSYAVFLQAFGVKNRLFLQTHGYTPDNVNQGLEHELAEFLIKTSAEGDNKYHPLSKADLKNCYYIVLSGTATSPCRPL